MGSLLSNEKALRLAVLGKRRQWQAKSGEVEVLAITEVEAGEPEGVLMALSLPGKLPKGEPEGAPLLK